MTSESTKINPVGDAGSAEHAESVPNQPKINQQAKNKKIVWILAFAAISMFGFGFALAPLYQFICSVTGFNNIGGAYDGRISAAEYADIKLAKREVTIQFDSTLSSGLDWEFKPTTKMLKVKLGQVSQTNYSVTNAFNYEVITQAVPSVTPWQAGQYIKKVECFCFEQQTLAAGEHKDMPLVFVIDPDLPKEINTITLSYTLMNVKPEKRVAMNSLP